MSFAQLFFMMLMIANISIQETIRMPIQFYKKPILTNNEQRE